MLAITALAGCGSATDVSSADPGGVTRVSADYYGSARGVRVGIRVAFAEDRRVNGARLVWAGGSSDHISPYPMDGTDPGVALEFLDLEAGEGVLLEGQLLSPCPDPPAPPVFEVATVVDGEKVMERYTPDDAALFAEAFSEYCQNPLTAEVALSEITMDGDISVTLRLTNPGPAPVQVVSEGFVAGNSTWEAASSNVAPGTEGTLELRGHDPARCAGTPPWEAGHLLADGRPLALSGETWC